MRRDYESSVSAGEVSAMLTDRIEQLAGEIFPNGRTEKREFCIGSLAGEPGQSLRIHVGGGAKRGVWRDFSAGVGGDGLDLIAHALFAGNKKEAFKWALSWLGLNNLDPARLEQRRQEAKAKAAEQAEQARRAERKRIERARRMWHSADVLRAGDPVYSYLASRAIDWAALGRAPGACRFHPKLQYGFGGPQMPVMIWMINNLAGEQIGVHRTYLAQNRDGTWRKADERELGTNDRGKPNDCKKVYGVQVGGHLPLWKGKHRRCKLADIPAGTDIYVSEGAEDGLTVASADPSLYVIAMLNVGNLATLELPPQMGRLVLLKQNDPPDSDAARSIAAGIAAQTAKGRRVMVVEPPRGVKDLNDLARAGSAAAMQGAM